MKTDTERLEWLESQMGCALVNDDNGHWACVCLTLKTYIIEKNRWYASIREAIDNAMSEDSPSVGQDDNTVKNNLTFA